MPLEVLPMARSARRDVIDPSKIQVLHCTQRCVRGAFLCGRDERSGNCYEHRRGWIVERLEFLASVFAIDCLTYSVMSNHLHIVLRSRPDIVALWSDQEIAERWLRLFPKRRDRQGDPAPPSEAERNQILSDPKRVAVLRRQLSDVSWWMRCTSEPIARRSNKEDHCKGRFWEGRFGCQELLDEASLLACAVYVDLNPIRAALAETLEASEFCGAQARIVDLFGRGDQQPISDHARERGDAGARSGWLSPLEIDERQDPLGPDAEPGNRRASRKGFLPLSLSEYLDLADWTGRQLRADKRGVVPATVQPILARLGLEPENWCEVTSRFGKLFKRAAGTRASLAEEAKRRGLQWLQAPGSRLLSPAV